MTIRSIKSIRTRHWLFILPALCLLGVMGASVMAKDATVKLDDGREITGELVVENNKEVVLDIAGIRTSFSRENVKDVIHLKSIDEQYRERRDAIADDDLEKRYDLTRWLFENKGYKLAQLELADLIERFPRDGRLVPLNKLIDARLKLLEEPAATTKDPASTTPANQTPKPVDKSASINFESAEVAPRFNDEQINLVRVYDINLTTRPNVRVPNDVMEEVYKNYAGKEGVPMGAQEQRKALGVDGWRKLQLLFDLRARELYSRVTVYNDPKTVQDFKVNIHSRYVLSYCATNACHGGKDAGNFFMFRFQPGSNETVYANYYILNRYSDAKGYMVDREKPELSYLVQYGLARQAATSPHPDVPGWKPIMQNLQDNHAGRVMEWIRNLGTADTAYPVNYAIPRVDKNGNVVTTQAPAPTQQIKP